MSVRASRRFVAACGFAALACAPGAAQRTWIVDAANGPGTHFRDLPPALTRAKHGDTVVVRKGAYTPGSTSQGIAILGEVGARVRGTATFRVTGLPAGRALRLAGLLFDGSISRQPLILLRDNAGRVHFERVEVRNWYGYSTLPPAEAVCIERCRAVTIANCKLAGAPAVTCISSALAVVGSTVSGHDAQTWNEGAKPSAPALVVSQSSLAIAESVVTGGAATKPLYGRAPASPAIATIASHVTLTGDTTSVNAGVPVGNGSASAVRAFLDTIVVGPGVRFAFYNAPWIGGLLRLLQLRRVPALRGAGAPPGGRIVTGLLANSGDTTTLLIGVPRSPTSTPWGQLWLDTGAILIADSGPVDARGRRAAAIAVPNVARLRGAVLGLQTVTVSTKRAVALSTPLVVLID